MPWLGLPALISLLCLACGGSARAASFEVLTTTWPIYWFARNVAGDAAEVHSLLTSQASPHEFQLSIGDVQRLRRADVIFINGLGLEHWLQKILRQTGRAGASKIFPVFGGLDGQLIYEPTQLHLGRPLRGKEIARRPAESAQFPNPHLWLDPRLAARAVTNICRRLERLDPAHAVVYSANASKYLKRLAELDAELDVGLTPLRDRAFVTYHDAFAYFARRYRLRLVGVIEPVPDAPPSWGYLKGIIQAIRYNHAKVIFTERPDPPKLARQIACDLRIATAQLDPLETGTLEPGGYEAGLRRDLGALERFLNAP